MTNLIRAEIFKLVQSKTLWLLIIIITGLSTLLHSLVITDWWQLSGTEFDRAQLSELNALSAFTLPLLFSFIVSALAGFHVSTEFSQSGVIKNQIISGHHRAYIYMAKYLVFSLGSIIVTILIPLLTAIILVLLFGHGDLINLSNFTYLGRAFSLFTLQFLCFTAVVLWIAIGTGDSGQTIIFTLLLSIIMFIIEKFLTYPVIQLLYENSFFYQFSEVFHYSMTTGEILKSIVIAIISLIVILIGGMFVFNRKEIK